MKIYLILLAALISFSAFAMDKREIDQLLREKNTSLRALEASGAKVLLGEVTGHGKEIQFAQVQAVITRQEAILKREIDSVSFDGKEVLGNVQMIRFEGRYILREDVRAVIVK